MCPTNKGFLFISLGFMLVGCLGPMARGPRPSFAPNQEPLRPSAVQKKKSVPSLSLSRGDDTSGQVFSLPLNRPRVISSFGSRGRKFHGGIDLVESARGGDPVRASRDGVVEIISHRGGYGRMVLLRHKDRWLTRYAHLRKISVRSGQSIQRGETLGFVGESGRASGPHLHFEILTPSNKKVDPTPFLFPLRSANVVSPCPAATPSPVSGLPQTLEPRVGRP